MTIIKGQPDNYGELYDTESSFRPPPMEPRIEYLPPSPYMWVVAVDLGSQNDSTAITILEVGKGYAVTNMYRWDNAFLGEKSRQDELYFTVKHLHRPRLGVSYPAIIDEVTSILQQLGPFPTVVSPAATWGQVRTGMRLSMSSSKRP